VLNNGRFGGRDGHLLLLMFSSQQNANGAFVPARTRQHVMM
jgi:hypothetical protein